MAKELFLFWTDFTGPLPILGVAEATEEGTPKLDAYGYTEVHNPLVYQERVGDSTVKDAKGSEMAQLHIALLPLLKRPDAELEKLRLRAVAFSEPVRNQTLTQQYKGLIMRNKAQRSGLVV